MESCQDKNVRLCKFVLTRGKREGQVCGARISRYSLSTEFCARHEEKAPPVEAKKIEMPQYDLCSICQDDILNNKFYLPCGHVFHKECVASWIQTKDTCPMCRAKYESLVAPPPPVPRQPVPAIEAIHRQPRQGCMTTLTYHGVPYLCNRPCQSNLTHFCGLHARMYLEQAYPDRLHMFRDPEPYGL